MPPNIDPITAGYIANIATNLTGYIIAGARWKIKQQLQGTEEQRAMRRSIEAGLVALLASTSAQAPEASHHLSSLFERFFTDQVVGEAVGQELTLILYGNELDVAILRELFEAAGYDADTLSHLDFDFEAGMHAFRYAFLLNAVQEPPLQPIIQTGAQITQILLLREIRESNEQMADTLQAVVALLRQPQAASLTIQAGQISVGSQVIAWPRLEGGALPPPATDWEQHYLEALIARCDPLDLTPR